MYGLNPVGMRPYGVTFRYTGESTPPPTLTQRMKYYNGSAWVAKPLKYFNGSVWVEKEIKATY